MVTWCNVAKAGKTFGSLTVENDVNISFDSAIAVKRDENTIVIYANVTSAEVKFMDKSQEFVPGCYSLTIYTNDHTDSYGKERKVCAAHRFIAASLDAVDGYKTYFSGFLSAANDRMWTSFETGLDTRGKALPPEGLEALRLGAADFESIEGKGALEGKEVPADGAGGYQKKMITQGEVLNQKLEWIKTQYLAGSEFRTVADSMGLSEDTANGVMVGFLEKLI